MALLRALCVGLRPTSSLRYEKKNILRIYTFTHFHTASRDYLYLRYGGFASVSSASCVANCVKINSEYFKEQPGIVFGAVAINYFRYGVLYSSLRLNRARNPTVKASITYYVFA